MHKLNDLNIWKKAIDLSVDIYKVTSNFPEDERFGLISQMRRSAVSIPSNIAEGAGRNSDKEFTYFLGISNGSSNELLSQMIIAKRLTFVDDNDANSMIERIDEIQKMNYGLKSSLEKKVKK